LAREVNMTESERSRHESDAAGYMVNCTDNQLYGVVDLETARIKNAPEGDVAAVARIMLRAAKAEMQKRGLL
jgi:hypothetical protein